MGTVVKEKDGRIRVRIRRKVRGVVIDKSARFERMTDARKWDQQIEAEIAAGKFFKTVEAEQHTLNDVINRYKQHLGLENPRRLKTATHLLDWWGAKLGHHLLADLTQAAIAKAMDDLRMEIVPNRKKGLKYTNATVNRYKSALQSALNMAVSPWCWLEDNPAKKMKNLKEPPGRDRFLNKEEMTALLDQCRISENPYLYSIVIVALSSGARREEIRAIKWTDVLLDEGKVVLRKTKNKKNRTIHLAHHALAEIRKRHSVKGKHDVYVFPSDNDVSKPIDFRRAWRTALKRSKLTDFRFHDLRHTAASYLAMNGATPSEIAEVLGHQSLAMVKRYAHLCDTHTAKVVKRMNESMFTDEQR